MKILQLLKEITEQKPKQIVIMYTERSMFYAMKVDGKKIRYKDAEQLIDVLTGLELPYRAVYNEDAVLEIIEALREQGIEAENYEVDMS